MAVERLVINIEGNADSLDKAIKSAENRLNSLNTRISNTSRSLTRMQSMFASLGASFGSLGATTANLERRLNGVANSTRSAGNAAQRARTQVGGLTQGFKDSVVALSSVQTMFYQYAFFVGGFVTSLISINSEYEKQTVLLKGLAKTGSEAQDALQARSDQKYLWDLAANAPFNIDSLTKAFVKLKAAGMDPTNGALQTLADSIAAFGGDSENLKMASLAISQMASKGVVSMEELRQQLADSGGIPDAINAMAEGLGYSKDRMKDFFDLVKTGTVAAGPAIGKMLEVLESRHKGAAEKMMNTWSGLIARLQTAYAQFVIKVNESNDGGFFNTLKAKVEQLVQFLNTPAGDKFAADISNALARIVIGLANMIQFIWEWRDEIVTAAKIAFAYWIGKIAVGSIVSLASGIGGILGPLIRFGNGMATAGGAAGMLGRVGASATTAIWNLADRLGFAGGASAAGARGLLMFVSRLGLIGAGTAVVVGGLGYLINKLQFTAINAGKLEAEAGAAAGTLDRLYKEAIKNSESQQIVAGMMARANGVINSQKKQVDALTNAYQSMGVMAQWAAVQAASAAVAAARAETNKQQMQAETFIQGGRATGNPLMQLVGYWQRRDVKPALAQEGVAQKTLIQANKELAEAIANRSKPPAPSTSTNTPVGDSDKDNKGDKGPKSDGLDGLRSRAANLQVELARLRAEAKGVTDEFDSWDAEQQAEEDMKLIKSKEDLKKKVNGLTESIKSQKLELKNKEKFDELTATVKDQANQAKEAFEGFVDDANKYETSITRYAAKLRETYKDQLDPTKNKNVDGNGSVSDVQNKILTAEAEKRREIIFLQAEEIRQKNEELRTALMTESELRTYEYNKEVERINGLLALNKQSNQQEILAYQEMLQYKEQLRQRYEEQQNPIMGKLIDWARDAKDFKSDVGGMFTGLLDGFVSDLANGTLSFKKFVKQMLAGLLQIIIRALIAQAILAAIGYSGGPSAPSAFNSSAFGTSTQVGNVVTVTPRMHTGGIVGKGNNGQRKSVDASMFNFAKKYHTGGIVGLGKNEVPIVAEKGEGVFTREQMKAMGSQNGPSNIQVNVINQTGTQAEVEQKQPRFDGERYVQDIILKKMSTPGPVRDAMISLKGR